MNPTPPPEAKILANRPRLRGRTFAAMGCNPDLETTNAMYELYQAGKTCTQVAAVFKVTRQGVWDRFKRQGLKLRPSSREIALPFIEHDGKRYAPNKDNYFRKTTGDRSLLHWDVWEKANGSHVKRGWVVRFVDGDRMNLDPDNLESVPKGEDRQMKPVTPKPCLACKRLMGRRVTGEHPEGPSAYAKRKTCNAQCSANWKKGRPRGARMK
jgi:hypothetical protein